jgi:glutamine cyclotransferase
MHIHVGFLRFLSARGARPLLVATLLTACGGKGDESSSAGAPPALLLSMQRSSSTNADAVPPAVPYDSATPRAVARAVARWPHDTGAFTQGLAFSDGRLLEGTGLEGHSEVREVERTTGRVRRRTALPAAMFGEGITVIGRRLYQLTWKHGRGYVYDATTLAPLDSFAYAGEGWGLGADGRRLYLSDGTSHVRVIDPGTFRVERTIQVREAGRPVWMLNELEWVRGELWANVYQTNLVARIDPNSGRVLGWVDLGSVLTPAEREAVLDRGGVANGIAFDSARERLLVTGKLWPWTVEVDRGRLMAASATSDGRRSARGGSGVPGANP